MARDWSVGETRMSSVYDEQKRLREIRIASAEAEYQRKCRIHDRAIGWGLIALVAGVVAELSLLWVWAVVGVREEIGTAWGVTGAVVGMCGLLVVMVAAMDYPSGPKGVW